MKEAMIAGFISAHLKIDTDFLLEVELRREVVLAALVTQINKDVVAKMDQDVEILSISLPAKNTLNIVGRAGAMGIKKEFTIHSQIVHDQGNDLVALKVSDIEIKGGFLVKKGFSFVESMIREKIEGSAKVELGKVLKGLKPSLRIPGSENKIAVSIDEFDLSTLELNPDGEQMKLVVKVSKAEIRVGQEK